MWLCMVLYNLEGFGCNTFGNVWVCPIGMVWFANRLTLYCSARFSWFELKSIWRFRISCSSQGFSVRRLIGLFHLQGLKWKPCCNSQCCTIRIVLAEHQLIMCSVAKWMTSDASLIWRLRVLCLCGGFWANHHLTIHSFAKLATFQMNSLQHVQVCDRFGRTMVCNITLLCYLASFGMQFIRTLVTLSYGRATRYLKLYRFVISVAF